MDKKAKQILFKTYWSSQGWIDRKDRFTDPNDFEYAKSKGLMFDSITMSHDECIDNIVTLVKQISKKKVCKAFLSSLSSRRLDWRSSISSYYLGGKMKLHKYTPKVSGHSYEDGKIVHTAYTCGICREVQYGVIGNKNYIDADLNVLNFERIKWGGVRHGDLLYTYLDLRCFSEEDIPEPTTEDKKIFKDILEVISTSQPQDAPGVLEKRLKDVIKGNKAERQILIEILACIGLLEAKSYDRPIRGKNDWVYVTYWRGEDKYNKDVLDEYFSMYLI